MWGRERLTAVMGVVGGVAASVVISWTRNGEIHRVRLDLPAGRGQLLGPPGVGFYLNTRWIRRPIYVFLQVLHAL